MKNKKIFYFPHSDLKSKYWGENIKKGKVIQLKSSPFMYFLIVWYQCLLSNSSPIFYFRYLNDHKILLVQLLRIFTDILLILTCRMLGGDIRWIAHNLDKDSYVFHKKSNSLRRNIISRYAKKIFVTDKELTHYADFYLSYPGKVDSTSFGFIKNIDISCADIDIQEKITEIKKTNKDIIFGLCATTLSDKCYHLKMIEEILNSANQHSLKLMIIFVANFKNNLKYQSLRERLIKRNDIIIYDSGPKINEQYLSSYIDFVYRSLSDISVPLSIYTSTSAKIPLLTHEIGFCGKVIKKYNIGYVIPQNKFNYNDFSNYLSSWDKSSCDNFLKDRTWKLGAEKLTFDN